MGRLPRQPSPARPKFGDPIPQPAIDARDLRNLIVEHFDKEGLAELCAEVQADLEVRAINLQVNLDMVGGSSKTNIVLNLINYLESRGLPGCLEVRSAGCDRTRSSDRLLPDGQKEAVTPPSSETTQRQAVARAPQRR